MYRAKPRADDYIQQLAEHIKKALAKGYTIDSLRYSLGNQGYSRLSIEKAIELANLQLAESAPKMIEKPQITYNIEPKPEPIKQSFWQKLKGFFS